MYNLYEELKKIEEEYGKDAQPIIDESGFIVAVIVAEKESVSDS